MCNWVEQRYSIHDIVMDVARPWSEFDSDRHRRRCTRNRVAAAIGIAAGIGAVALAISAGLTGHSQALDSPGLAPGP
jgi:hypothetical protein